MKGNRNVSWGKRKTWALYKCAREETKGFFVCTCTFPGILSPRFSHKWHQVFLRMLSHAKAKPCPCSTAIGTQDCAGLVFFLCPSRPALPRFSDGHLPHTLFLMLYFSFLWPFPLSPALILPLCSSPCSHTPLPYCCGCPLATCSACSVSLALSRAPAIPYYSELHAYKTIAV